MPRLVVITGNAGASRLMASTQASFKRASEQIYIEDRTRAARRALRRHRAAAERPDLRRHRTDPPKAGTAILIVEQDADLDPCIADRVYVLEH